MPAFPSTHYYPPPPSPSSYSELPPLDDFDPPLNAPHPSVKHFLSPPHPSLDEEDGAGIINSDDYHSTEDIYISLDDLGGGGNWRLHLPPGVKFRPTDEELITHYLKPQVVGGPLGNVQPLVYADVYDYEPQQLSDLAEDEGDGKRYFYSRIKKIKSTKTERSIKSKKGSWRPTQAAKSILGPNGITIGYKLPLAYFEGSNKTQWLMQEFKLELHPPPEASHQLVLVVVYYHDRKRKR